MGDDGKPRLGRFGELLDADRNQVLGEFLRVLETLNSKTAFALWWLELSEIDKRFRALYKSTAELIASVGSI